MTTFFNGRAVIDAGSLMGPRVYSTDLFPALFRTEDPKGSVEIAARALKVKLITKGLVTLNSLYLVSPVGVALFENDTGLFDGDGILPAFRDDQAELEALVARNEQELAAAGIGTARIDEHLAKLKNSVKSVLPWRLGDVGESLRKLLVSGLSNGGSRISVELSAQGFDSSARDDLLAKIKGADMSASANVRGLLNVEPQAAARLLNAFVTASYHKVGAAVVNCEIGTDLNPLSEYKAADMLLAARSADGAQQLSDEAIFLDTFAATALAAVQGLIAGDIIIDTINFKTAHQLGAALREQGFQSEYERTIAKVMSMTSSNGPLDLDNIDMDGISEAVTNLHTQFTDTIARELPNYTTQAQREAKQRVIQVGADLSRDIAGQVPGLSNIVSTFDAIEHLQEGAAAGWEMISIRETQKSLADGARKRQEKMTAAVNTLYGGQKSKSKLLDGVAVMTDLYIKAIERT
ncbi:hypothetical protein HFN97_20535 [Rhizobium laguerreae]|uniref:hypothetical protein n=1 Tax=Rhizobium laguerreae TaxID=1076926 RepID=UPI001C929A35|nr:hypothetical protein [Rhizobium laguerreae]MBY3360185.1 hypothetical protein [Rhizobium laguerreae]